jgi:hypothetical protein
MRRPIDLRERLRDDHLSDRWPPLSGGRKPLIFNNFRNRDGRIRTGDPLNPIQVRYRAAPRPVIR